MSQKDLIKISSLVKGAVDFRLPAKHDIKTIINDYVLPIEGKGLYYDPSRPYLADAEKLVGHRKSLYNLEKKVLSRTGIVGKKIKLLAKGLLKKVM